jgi:hypothetical protein
MDAMIPIERLMAALFIDNFEAELSLLCRELERDGLVRLLVELNQQIGWVERGKPRRQFLAGIERVRILLTMRPSARPVPCHAPR